MKIAFVSDFYSPSIGGTQILTQEVCEGFRALGHEVEVCTSPDDKRDFESYGYKINEINGLNFFNSKVMTENEYDAVFVFADLLSPSLATINLNNIPKSILVLNLDENVYRWIKEGRVSNLSHLVQKIKSFDTVISFCQGAPINAFLNHFKIKYHFIPNFSRDCLQTEKANIDIRKVLGINDDKKIIFNHGLIEDRKNQLYLCKKLNETSLFENHVMVFLGSPRDRTDIGYLSKINHFIAENNLSNSIKMVKGTSNKGLIDQLLVSSDIYILPSKAEGLPLVLIEAMSSGLPWISTPVGGVPSVFGQLSGGVVLDQIGFTSENLEDAIRSVPSINTSRSEWEDNFTKEIAIQRYQKLLDSVR